MDVKKRLFQGFKYLRLFKDMIGGQGHFFCFKRFISTAGADKTQPGASEVHHDPAHRTNVDWALGADKDNTEMIHGILIFEY
jgi:hypothetical protein